MWYLCYRGKLVESRMGNENNEIAIALSFSAALASTSLVNLN